MRIGHVQKQTWEASTWWGEGRPQCGPAPGSSHTREDTDLEHVVPYSETAEPLVEVSPWQVLFTKQAS